MPPRFIVALVMLTGLYSETTQGPKGSMRTIKSMLDSVMTRHASNVPKNAAAVAPAVAGLWLKPFADDFEPCSPIVTA